MTEVQVTPAVVINGDEISMRELFRTLNLKGLLRPMLHEVVIDHITAKAALEQDLNASTEELQKAADAFRMRRGLNKAADTERWLAANGISHDELETALERAILQRKLVNKVADGHIDKFFAENRDRFDRARIARIVVKEEGVAEELLSQIREGEITFAGAARQHSIDRRNPAGAVATRKRLPANIAQAVFSAKAGDVVGPFQVGERYHLLQVSGIRLGELNGRTRALIRRALFRKWLNNAVQTAKVEIKLHQCI